VIATLLDEAMSKAVRTMNVPAMTRSMEIDYRRPVPSRTPLRIEGLLVRSEERKHWTEARILDGKGVVLAEGKGLFVQVRASRMGIREERPEGRPDREEATRG
jgi:acyl-coenzyme A thioesterase PaaI-like protein